MNGSINSEKVREFTQFQINRHITNLYKQFLFILEDIRDNKYNITSESYQQIRKRILDISNDTLREMEEYLNKLEINIKQ